MKCIKCIKQTKSYDLDEIRRTDDQDAEEKVRSGVWKFIPKEEWKGTLKKAVVKNETIVSPEETDELTIAEKQLKGKKKKVKDDKGK
jgi:hypothetical protein